MLETGILNINKESYYISEDGWFNKNKIEAEKQQEAVAKAQKEMKNKISKNNMYFEKAEKKARNLIENYILELGNLSNVEYTVEWVVQDDIK